MPASIVLAIGHGHLTHTRADMFTSIYDRARGLPLQPAAEPGMERGVVQPIPRQKCPDQCRLR